MIIINIVLTIHSFILFVYHQSIINQSSNIFKHYQHFNRLCMFLKGKIEFNHNNINNEKKLYISLSEFKINKYE